jgi:hypothetical protein
MLDIWKKFAIMINLQKNLVIIKRMKGINGQEKNYIY